MFRQISVLLLISFFSVLAFSQTQQSEQNSQSSELLSKPNPNYTSKARNKGIEGTVTLRVTFLANGEIGDVIYLSESSKKKSLTKYGLVDKAIEAAKQIKFVSAKKNGQPISVSKVLVYSFTIY